MDRAVLAHFEDHADPQHLICDRDCAADIPKPFTSSADPDKIIRAVSEALVLGVSQVLGLLSFAR